MRIPGNTPVTNRIIAEILAREAERTSGTAQRAFRRAARTAFLWPEEATQIVSNGGSLTSLAGVGPFLEKYILNWIENPRAVRAPAIRRDFVTMAEARSLLRSDHTWENRLRGDMQMHTRWSDGSGTVSEMAQAGEAKGYEYIAVTDHSKGLKIAGGIDERALAQQAVEIDRANRTSRCQVLKSIEMNLSAAGQGDMDAGALGKLDIVLGSFHSALRTTSDQTSRYMKAIRNPQIHILAHPRGRIYNFRIGLLADWQRVFSEAARLDKALEIDCYPDRQDLNVSLLKLAKREGVRISVGTDAHHAAQLEFIQLGLAAARLAMIPADRVLNFLPASELKEWAARVRES